MVEHNWAGNVAYGASSFHAPSSVREVREIVASATKVRAVGSRHSFNTIADTDGEAVSLSALPRVFGLDAPARRVTVGAGIKYGELSAALHEQGWAVANMASLPHISVAGACATATHGSGTRNGNLATAVQGMELVSASGDLVRISRDDDPELMDAMVVGLGAFGIVTSLTLSVQPAFEIAQRVYEHLPTQTAIADLAEIMNAGYSVSLFTSWRDDYIEQLWVKDKVTSDRRVELPVADRFGARAATRDMHPIAELSSESCTEQMGIGGPSHERLPHFRMGFTPSSGDELQSELFVAADDAPVAMQTLVEMHDALAPVIKISEVRAVAADELWMSPSYHRDCIAFHFTWVQSWPEVRPVLAMVERALGPYRPVPHWGKLSTLDGRVIRSRVERFGEFEALVAEWDPTGKFRNAYLDDLFG